MFVLAHSGITYGLRGGVDPGGRRGQEGRSSELSSTRGVVETEAGKGEGVGIDLVRGMGIDLVRGMGIDEGIGVGVAAGVWTGVG